MTKVIIKPDNIEFTVNDEQTVLEAGLSHKLNLPHGCKNGLCGACKVKLIDGEVKLDTYSSKTLSDNEINQGYTLLCKAHAKGDIVLDIPGLADSFAIKIMPAKVTTITKIHNIAIIKLKLPNGSGFGFHAGQYVEIMFNGQKRSYSIANSPSIPDEIEIHVKRYPDGVFSKYVWNELKLDSILRFRGPLGAFKIQKGTAPIVMVCTGSGFAPVKAIIEYLWQINDKRQIHLYWGNRALADFYMQDVLSAWQDKLNIHIAKCLSQEKHDGYFHGYVSDALLRDFTSLENCELYACGKASMIEDIFELAVSKLSLPKSKFFSDAFIPSITS